MKKNLFLLLVAVLLMSSLAYATFITMYEDIGVVTRFNSLDIPLGVGIAPPLEIKRGERLTIEGEFEARDFATNLKLKCYFVLNGIPLPLSGAYLDGITFPIINQNRYKCYMTFSIPHTMSPCSGKLKLELTDDKGRSYVGALIDSKIY